MDLRTITRKPRIAIRWARKWLLCPIDYHRSVAVLTEAESEARNTDQWFDVPLTYRGYGEFQSIRPKQVVDELRALYALVRDRAPRFVCEIGTYRGGTFYLWCKAAQPDATVVSIDLPGSPFGGGYSRRRIRFYQHFGRPRQRLCFLRDDSHAEGTVQKVKETLGRSRLDFLFIDGDHTYAGVRRDFELYGPLVHDNGLIALHDILPRHGVPEIEVHRLWREIRPWYRHQEIVAGGEPRIGIGVIWPDRGG